MTAPIGVVVISHLYPRANDLALGGFVHEHVRALQRLGCNVHVISPVPYIPRVLRTTTRRRAYRNVPDRTVVDGIPVEYPRSFAAPPTLFHGPTGSMLAYSLVGRVRKAMCATGARVLHAHCATPDGYAALHIATRLGVPAVCTLRGDDINLYPSYRPFTLRQTRCVIRGSDRVVTVSGALKIAARSIAEPRREIEVIYNGCDLDVFRPLPDARTQLRRERDIAETTPVLLFVGEMTPRKGIYELIEAFVYLARRDADARLWLVGETPSPAVSKALSSLPTQFGERVRIVGKITHSEVARYMSAADVLVLPTYNEGLPNVVREAMSCGLPVVATSVGGIPEIVIDGLTGVLVRPGDSMALFNALLQLLREPCLRREIGTNAARYAATHFSWEQNGRAHLALYEQLVSSHGLDSVGSLPCAG